MKKKDDIKDYCTAHDAAQILSIKHGRFIRPDYLSKMRRTKKHTIRTAYFGDRIMYHREDIAACELGQKRQVS